MNVSKIQKLSEQHESMKRFLKGCDSNDLILIAKLPPYPYGGVELDIPTSRLISTDVCNALLKQISKIETAILECINEKK